jgi:hypothetical protein
VIFESGEKNKISEEKKMGRMSFCFSSETTASHLKILGALREAKKFYVVLPRPLLRKIHVGY